MYSHKIIEQWINEVLNQECWEVTAGGCTGSAFDLKIGDRSKRERPLSNPNLSQELREYDSVRSLFIRCSPWQVGIEDAKIIADSDDDCSPNGPLVQGLRRLIGTVINEVIFNSETCDLNVYFSSNIKLKVSGSIPKNLTGYSLVLPCDTVSIHSGRKIRHENFGEKGSR